MMPYTPATIDHLRKAAACGAPSEALRLFLDWDRSMLRRVCAQHGIELADDRPPPKLVAVAVAVAVAAPVALPFAPANNLEIFEARLSRVQLRIWHKLKPTLASDQWVTCYALDEKSWTVTRVVEALNSVLRARNLPRHIESRLGRARGWRMVVR